MKTNFSFLMLLFAASVANAAPCPVTTSQEVLRCAVQQHPEVIRAAAALKATQATRPAARQIPNPELESDFTSFSDDNKPNAKLEAAYLHTFELGSKRARRVRHSDQELQRAETSLEKTLEEIARTTMANLHRLRQIQVELRLVDEAIESFEKITTSYAGRLRRSAEQDVSRFVFSVATADYRIRRSALIQEQTGLAEFFFLTTGQPLETIVPIANAMKTEWADGSNPTGSNTSVIEKEAAAGAALADAELSLANSAAWPDLRIGPRIEMESGRGQDAQGYGAALSLGLPLYHRNGGFRTKAEADLERARAWLAQTKRETTAGRQRWLAVYREAVATEKAAISLVNLETQHEAMERQFMRGILPASLVIESHRQIADYALNRHVNQLKAVEALWHLYMLDGRPLEKRL